jgi:hypothetical protein
MSRFDARVRGFPSEGAESSCDEVQEEDAEDAAWCEVLPDEITGCTFVRSMDIRAPIIIHPQ